jgi:hypothetical protein
VALIALLFGAVAVWSGASIAGRCVNAIQLTNAAVVDASVLDVERRVRTVGDGAREEVTVTYTYEFEGRRFKHRTRRLALFGNSSRHHHRLEKAMIENQRVPCYVSRHNPTVSAFSCDFSVPQFLIALVFPVAFGAVSLIAIRTLVQNWRIERRTANKCVNRSGEAGAI